MYCIVPLRSDVGLVELKGAAYLMSSPMVALVVRELVMLLYNQRLNERGAVSWDLDYLHSANATELIKITFKDFSIFIMYKCLQRKSAPYPNTFIRFLF